MKEYRLAEGEAKFADIIWDYEPVGSMQLVKLSEEQLGWKKSTTFTVLKKLCDRGLFQNKESVVTSLVTREEFASGRSRQFVEESFGGSLPKFFNGVYWEAAAFQSGSRGIKDTYRNI